MPAKRPVDAEVDDDAVGGNARARGWAKRGAGDVACGRQLTARTRQPPEVTERMGVRDARDDDGTTPSAAANVRYCHPKASRGRAASGGANVRAPRDAVQGTAT